MIGLTKFLAERNAALLSLDEKRARAEEIRGRVGAASEGPWLYWEHWDVNHPGEHLHGVHFGGELYAPNQTCCDRPEDSKFIAHSRDDIPYLLSLVEAQHVQTTALETQIATLETEVDLWQASAMLDGPYGDPSGITPLHNEQQVLKMRAQIEAADMLSIATKELLLDADGRLEVLSLRHWLGDGLPPLRAALQAYERARGGE